MKTKSYEIDMCNGPLTGKLLKFAVPLMFSGILQLLFNAADIVVVGRFAGHEALAAVGSTGSLINLLVNVFIGLSIGTNVLVANYMGARHEKAVSETVRPAQSPVRHLSHFLRHHSCQTAPDPDGNSR